MKKLTLLAATITTSCLLHLNAHAQPLYKCQLPNGKVQYSDAACSADPAQGRIVAPGNAIDSSGHRELMLRQENEKLREQLRQRDPGAVRAAPRSQQDLQAERIDTVACERARRDYEVTASSTSNGVAVVEAKRSIMYGMCGMRETDRSTVIVNPRTDGAVSPRVNVR